MSFGQYGRNPAGGGPFGPPPPPQAPSPPASPQEGIVHQIADHQQRIILGILTLPVGWQLQSQVAWDRTKSSVPVRVFARATELQSSGTMVEFLPQEGFCWIEPNIGFQQPGQEATGGFTCMPPMSAADTIFRWILPRYRGNLPDLRVVGVSPLPQLGQMLGVQPVHGGQYEGVHVRVAYSENGRLLEEDFFGLKVVYPGIPTYGAAGILTQYNWGFDRLFTFRAEAGQLDAVSDRNWAIVRSFRMNPQWEQMYAQVLQQLQQQFNQHIQAGYENIAAASRLSQQISANNQSWLDHQAQRREQEHRSDQMRRQQEQSSYGAYSQSDAFGDRMMGRETYHDPYWQYGSQHDGYHDYVWTDSQGNYQYSDDANFDPNIGASVNWTLMQKKQVGD
jgi:hypothetical protein